MAKFKKGDQVRFIKAPVAITSPKYFTSVLTVREDDSDCPLLNHEQELAGCSKEDRLIPADAAIRCDTQAQFNRLMEELEKVGYTWALGQKPTEHKPNQEPPFKIEFHENNLTHGVCSGNEIPVTDLYNDIEEETKEDEQPRNKFKPGDIVVRKGTGRERTVKHVPGMSEYDGMGFSDPEKGMTLEEGGWDFQEDYELAHEHVFEAKHHMSFNPRMVRATETLTSEALQRGIEILKQGEDNQSQSMSNTSTLQKLTRNLKRVLNKNMQAQYKAGFRNGDLELTHEGKEALLDLLAIEYENDLSKAAQEHIDEVKEESEE